MTIEVDWVPYGRPAAERLAAGVAAAKGGDPLAPVTVVVPSNYVGVASRRRLACGAYGPLAARGRGIAGVSFLTVYRLGELLGAAALAASGRRPVSTPVLGAAVRSALRARPGLFAPVAEHPATEEALVTAYRELRELDDEALERLARASIRAAEVVRLHRAARAALVDRWFDEQDLLEAAVGQVAADTPVTTQLGAVVLVHLPQRLTRHGRTLLRAVAEQRRLVVLAGTTGDARADADVRLAVELLTGDSPAPAPAVPTVVDPARTRVVSASDADDEVRAAVRAIVDAARDGTALERVAVLHASPEPYARLVYEHLTAAGIPANGAATLPLSARVYGRTLLDLLALGDHGYRRQDVFAVLGCAPVRHEGRVAPVSAWERLSRDAAVVAGRGDWDAHLDRLASELEAQAAEAAADPEQPSWRVERDHEDARRARALRDAALHLIDELERAAAAPQPWRRRVDWAKRLLRSLLGDEHHRAAWPRVERDAADKVDAALDRLAALDAIDGPATLDVFRRTLRLELDSDLGRVGRFGDGVLVGSIGMGIGLDLDLVVVLGLAEGTFPARVADDSLLPDDERARCGPDLPRRADRIEREHRELLAALAAAPRHLLGLPRGDLRASTQRVPSRWLLDLASELEGDHLWSDDLASVRASWLHHVPSFAGGIAQLEFPSTAQEHRLRTLLGTATVDLVDAARAAADDVLASGAATIAARRSHVFTSYDGNLAGLAIPSPATAVISPTRLEQWAECPHGYFMRTLLGVEPVDDPEEALEITPIHRGNLVHRALEEFITEVLARPVVQQPAPDDPWSPDDRARLADIGGAVCDEYEALGHTGRPLFWRRDRRRILAELDRFLSADDAHRKAHRTRPLAAELAFGLHSGLGAVELSLPSGRTVRFRGRADRIDIADDGSLHVVDYKTGSTRDYERLSDSNPDERGTKLQLPVYALAARLHQRQPDAPVVAEYWFVTSRTKFTRKGYPVTDDVLSQFATTLDVIVDGIEGGVFPARPDDSSTRVFIRCRYCEPDGLGTGERRREWERKREHPALHAYATLCEPDELATAR